MKPTYWSLVVRRGTELARTPFRYGRHVHHAVIQVARERGYKIVAYVGVEESSLPRPTEWRLVKL